MGLKELSLCKSYISCGQEGIASALLVPSLCVATSYKRCAGFFCASVFETIFEGIQALATNKGTLQILTSPKLGEQDIQAIKNGYQ
ncbi:MAG: DNA repair protein, partial [Firmicutes bacterium]|nr:DNA repair protein [Bacillota bacterium]